MFGIDVFYLTMMTQAFVICLVLTGIHGYLGFHVLARKVIFVDLAMAQIAALGTTYAIFLGFDPSEHGLTVYFYSLGFTLLGAFFFAITRMEHADVPHEAIIGIIYATASGLAILFLAKSPSSGAKIKQMLTGDILSVGWWTILKTTAIYSVIGVFHWIYREPFFMISLRPEEARAEGYSIRFWDFLFYATFGVVITSSVAIGGVLLVFSFLVIPATIAILFAETTRIRIFLGWGIGTVVSAAGILFSFRTDLPSGPSVVAAFAVTLALGGIIYYVRNSERALPAVVRVAVGIAVLTLLVGGATYYGHAGTQDHSHQERESSPLKSTLTGGDPTQKIEVIDHLKDTPQKQYVPTLLQILETSESERVKEHVIQTLRVYDHEKIEEVLLEQSSRESSPSLRLSIASELLRRGNREGLRVLLQAVETDAPVLTRRKAIRKLRQETENNFGYDSLGNDQSNREAVRDWKQFLKSGEK